MISRDFSFVQFKWKLISQKKKIVTKIIGFLVKMCSGPVNLNHFCVRPQRVIMTYVDLINYHVFILSFCIYYLNCCVRIILYIFFLYQYVLYLPLFETIKMSSPQNHRSSFELKPSQTLTIQISHVQTIFFLFIFLSCISL